MVKRMSNLYSFIYSYESTLDRSKYYFVFLLLMFYIQLGGLLFTVSQKPATHVFVKILFNIFEYSRLIPALSLLNSNIVAPAFQILMIIIEFYIIYSALNLSISSTKESSNNFKMKAGRIKFISFYFSHYKYIICFIKLDLTFGSYICGYQGYTNGRCTSNLDFSILAKEIWIILFILNILTSVIISFLIFMVYHKA